MAIDAGTTDIKALRVGSTVISRAFLGNQKIYDQLDYPTLDLNFALTKTLDPRVTFTRASTATYFDSAGVLRSAAINAPRFDYNPATLVAQGLLIEEQRTNSIRNNTMVGAVAGTPGTMPTNWFAATLSNGLARQVVGAGTENGISYIDVRYSGTTSATGLTGVYPETAAQVAALSGQTWTGSFYVSLVGGSTANTIFTVVGIDELKSGGTFLAASNTPFTLTSGGLSGKRYSHTRALTNASTAFIVPYLFFTYNSGAAIDITLRIGLPQLEQGAFATSVIPTTTTALTRALDAAAMTGTNFSSWYNQSEGTVSVAFDVYAPSVPDGYGRVYQIDDGTLNNNIALLKNNGFGSVYYGYVGVAGVVQVTLFTPAILANIPVKVATAYKLNDFAQSTNGESVTTDTSGTIPTVTQMRIGSTSGSAAMNGHIRRITYFNRRLANSELQLLSS
jgi:hypothetical protein